MTNIIGCENVSDAPEEQTIHDNPQILSSPAIKQQNPNIHIEENPSNSPLVDNIEEFRDPTIQQLALFDNFGTNLMTEKSHS
jgi:hypothetical protein